MSLDRVRVVASLCVLLWPSPVRGLDPSKAITQYVQDAWGTEDGLPQISVTAVVRGRDGYLWLGTQEGLVRFDGVRFRVYDKTNTPKMKSPYVQALLVDRAGNLWIGTYGGGLGRREVGGFGDYTPVEGLPHGIVGALCEDRQGALWVGTAGGLARLDRGRITTYTTRDGLPSDTVLALFADADGLWIGTSGGLARWRDGQFASIPNRGELPEAAIRAILVDRSGSLWIGTHGGGLARAREGSWTIFTTRHGLPSDYVSSLLEDRDGTLWIGFDEGGVTRFRNGRFEVYSKPLGLSGDSVRALHEDSEGNLWIGTFGGGLNRLRDARFTTYTTHEGLSNDVISAVYEDRGGQLWVGTAGGGLNRFREGRWTHYGSEHGLLGNSIASLWQTRDGSLWIGTRGGLTRLKEDSFERYPATKGLQGGLPRSLYEDREGNLWIGTDGQGLSRFEDGRFTRFTRADGLGGNTIFAILQSRDGSLWIGTDGGLTRMRADAVGLYTAQDGLAGDRILSLHEDAEGVLWIGTDGGLSRLRNGAFASFQARDGLFDDTIFRILEDGRGQLWMSCNKGIFRVAKSELEAFAGGQVAFIRSVSYGRADGMKGRECNGRFQPAGWKTRDRRLWFPTMKGVVVVDPERTEPNPAPVPIVVEQLVVNGRPLPVGGGVRVPAGSTHFEVHYAGLSLLAPEKLRFKYWLEGVDDGWVEVGGRRVAYYTNVPPGPQRFRVLASNSDGVWNAEETFFDFHIEPRFHQTYWFHLVCVLAVMFACWLVVSVRVRLVRARAAVLAERNRIAQEIHDTLAQGFGGIVVQLEAARRALEAGTELAGGHVETAARLARESLGEARRSVAALRPSVLETGDLAQALRTLAGQQLADTGIRCDVEVRDAPGRLSENVEIQLFRIAQEGLTNAIRHGHPRRVLIELVYDRRQITLRVVDDGRGFVAENGAHPAGFGLSGMRRRALELGGELSVQSRPGTGTTVSVTLRTRLGAWEKMRAWLDRMAAPWGVQ